MHRGAQAGWKGVEGVLPARAGARGEGRLAIGSRGPAARGEARAGRRDGEGRARQGCRGPAKRGSHRRDERDVPGV